MAKFICIGKTALVNSANTLKFSGHSNKIPMTQEFHISTDKGKLDIALIHHYLSEESYWAQGRKEETVRHSIENSLCFGVYDQNGHQVGFARVITDFTLFVWLCDLFILPSHQKRGLGKMLMKAITEEPRLQNLRRWGLHTSDAHGLYAQFGFVAIQNPEQAMERVNRVVL